nr:hypothetical protein [Tanacetum cinerariifolium]
MILSGADNRPLMLDKDLYDSWKSQMELYMQNKEHRRMILESIEHGHVIWPTIEENGVIRTKKYDELSVAEKIQADCDMKATNIILQGLHADIYSLVTHHIPKRPRNAAWYKEKAMLAEAQEARQILDEEQLTFLADPRIPAAVLMANISNYGSGVISEVPNSKTYLNDMDNQKKLVLKEKVDSLEQNLSKQIKEKENKYMETEIDLEKKIKELNIIVFKVGQSTQTVHMLTKPQLFYDNVHKQAVGYQNPFYLKKSQRIKPTLYDGIVISEKHVAMPVIDDEETLILEEESRSKMSVKAKDPEPRGCLLELGKVGEMMGSSVRVVEWAGKKGEWGYGAWREKRFGVNSNPFKTGGKMILFGFWGFYKVSP